jgi:serine/threonine-protein kinase
MARVYLALSKKAAGFSKLVVLKVLRSSTTSDPDLRRMFFDEARVAALLNHPNVVQTYEAGDDDGHLFLAMEYLEGKSLSALVAAGPPIALPLDVHLRIIADMLEGLHYAHGVSDVDGSPLDIVHRDVSPQNVLVTFAGQSKVVDFGIAKIAGSPHTQSGVIKGKVGYMAPEQIQNLKVDRRADVFAAGVMIWEAIAKRRLVRRGMDDVVAIAQRMSGDPSVRTVAPDGTPEELLAICDKAMSVTPERRYATALELHDALDRYLRKTGGADAKRVAEFLETSYGDQRKSSRAVVEEQLRSANDSSPLIDVSKHSMPTVAAMGRDRTPQSKPPSTPPSLPALHGDRRSVGASAAPVVDATPPPASAPTALSPRTIIAFVAGALSLATLGVVLMIAASSSASKASAHSAEADGATASPATSSAGASAGAGGGASAGATAPLGTQVDADAATPLADDAPQTLPIQPTPLAQATAAASASAHSAAGKPRKKRAIDDGDPYRR